MTELIPAKITSFPPTDQHYRVGLLDADNKMFGHVEIKNADSFESAVPLAQEILKRTYPGEEPIDSRLISYLVRHVRTGKERKFTREVA